MLANLEYLACVQPWCAPSISSGLANKNQGSSISQQQYLGGLWPENYSIFLPTHHDPSCPLCSDQAVINHYQPVKAIESQA